MMKDMIAKNDSVFKVTLFSALTALLITVPLRVYQYFKIINPETGFYDKIDFTVYAVYIAMAAAMLISIIYTYINNKKLACVQPATKSFGYFAVNIVMAVGAIADSAVQLAEYFSLYSADVPSSYYFVQDYVKEQGGSIMLLTAVFGGISAIYFFISGISVGLGNTNPAKFKIFALAPVIWSIFRLLYRFKRTISFTNVSDLLIELFAIVFAMMFYLAFAQVASKIDEEGVFRKLYAYGVPAMIFALVCFLPRLIVMLIGGKDFLNELHGINVADLTFAIYATYICIASSKTNTVEE